MSASFICLRRLRFSPVIKHDGHTRKAPHKLNCVSGQVQSEISGPGQTLPQTHTYTRLHKGPSESENTPRLFKIRPASKYAFFHLKAFVMSKCKRCKIGQFN